MNEYAYMDWMIHYACIHFYKQFRMETLYVFGYPLKLRIICKNMICNESKWMFCCSRVTLFCFCPNSKTCLSHMTSQALRCLIHLFLPPESCQQLARPPLRPFAVFPQTFSEDFSAGESRCLGTPLIELGIPPRKVAALLMKG